MACIYVLRNKLNKKIYVGQTIQRFAKRLWTHTKSESYIGNALRKNGVENFTRFIFYVPVESLDFLEIELIKNLKTMYPYGYNLTSGGGNGKCVKRRSKYANKQERYRDWYKRNPEKVKLKREKAKIWKQKDEVKKRKAEQDKKYWKKNIDKLHEKSKKYYLENKEKIIENQKKYCLEHKELIKINNRKCRIDNKEKIKEKKKKYYHDNRTEIRSKAHDRYIRNRKWYIEYAKKNKDRINMIRRERRNKQKIREVA